MPSRASASRAHPPVRPAPGRRARLRRRRRLRTPGWGGRGL